MLDRLGRLLGYSVSRSVAHLCKISGPIQDDYGRGQIGLMPYQTDERLKGYLDTNQLHREQMCLAVMAIDKRFSNVRPRHPRGGPDGGRDIEAIFHGVQRVFGAVGFVNQATDSDAHKDKAATKFNDDLTAALRQQPHPEVFVFFTNVNLTVGEKDDLVKTAKAGGMAHAEVFDRERIRVALDNPDGLSIRFQYLGIPLSEAEQATFFARWGDDIQSLISDGFVRVQRSLDRIHFLQEAALPLSHFTGILQLDREYRGQEIGHFRAFAIVRLKGPVRGIFSFMFGATDNSTRSETSTAEDLAKARSGIGESMCGGQWEMRIPENQTEPASDNAAKEDEDESRLKYQPAGSFTSVGQDPVKTIRVRYSRDRFIRFMPGPTLQDLDECSFLFCLNRRLAEKVKAIHIYANEYKLTEISSSGFRIDTPSFKLPVPLFFSVEELADPWVGLRPEIASAFEIRFSEQTPRRFFHAGEVTDSLE